MFDDIVPITVLRVDLPLECFRLFYLLRYQCGLILRVFRDESVRDCFVFRLTFLKEGGSLELVGMV